MHSCLFIDEILEQIGGFVASYSLEDQHTMKELHYNVSDRKSLLSFILTCRTFVEPGLNVLWSRIDNIFPLAFTFQPNASPRVDRAADGSERVCTN